PAPARASAPAPYRLSPILAVAGVLAVLAGVLPVIGLYQTYAPDFRLLSYHTSVEETLIRGVASLAAGLCLLVPRTSARIGTGLALGSVATLPSDIATFHVSLQIVTKLGTDAWIIVISIVLSVVATGLVGWYLARSRELRIDMRSLAGQPWLVKLVVLLGVVGAVAYSVEMAGRHYVNGLGPSYLSSGVHFLLFWVAIMALVIPVVAVTVRPRSFGVGLLAGWIVAGLAAVVFLTGLWTSVLGYTLIALAVLLVPLARTRTAASPPAPGGEQPGAPTPAAG
ncbi:MAG: hypothetical protein ABJB47_07235, partial [Actinomycetota bacterium]